MTEQRVREVILPSNGEPLRIVIERAPFPWKRVFTVVAAAAGLYVASWLFEHLSQVFIMLAVAGLLAFILDPLVVALQKRMPRWVGIVVTFVAFIAIVSLAALAIVPRIVVQLQQLQESAPQIQRSVTTYTDQVNAYLERVPPQAREQMQKAQTSINEWTNAMLKVFFAVLMSGLGWMGKGMIILVLAIYLLLDKDRLRDGFIALVPVPARAETLSVLGDVLVVLRAYLRGQIVVIGFVAVAVTVALWVAQMPYALTVGTLAGILEVIPYFGAVVGAIPGVLYSFAVHGMWGGIGMIVFFVCINQLEGHVVIPLVMGANLEMRPIAVLLSLLAGAELGGIVGLIVAVPVCRILQVLVEHGLQIYKDIKAGTAVKREARPLTEADVEAVEAEGHVLPGTTTVERAGILSSGD